MSTPLQNPLPTSQRSRIASAHAYLLVPVLMAVAIGWFAPNFKLNSEATSIREHPVGGDFLQEFVGGYLARQQTTDIYDLSRARQLQHDQHWLGFDWPRTSYFPMVYPPYYYLAVSPLSTLDYSVAARVWLLLMTAALLATLLLLRYQLQLSPIALCLVSLTAPVLLSLNSGQKSTLLLLIFTATYCLLRRGKPFSAGAVFALIAFKPHLAIPLGLVMLFKRQWRFLYGCSATLLVQLAVCGMMGLGVCGDYMAVCLGMGDYVQSGGYALHKGFSFWSAWQLLLGNATAAKIASVGSAAAVVIALLRCWRNEFDPKSDEFEILFSLVMIVTVLVAPHFYAYDLSVLVLPAALVFRNALAAKVRGSWIALLAILFFFTQPIMNLAASTSLPIGVAILMLLLAELVRLTGKPAYLQPVLNSPPKTC